MITALRSTFMALLLAAVGLTRWSDACAASTRPPASGPAGQQVPGQSVSQLGQKPVEVAGKNGVTYPKPMRQVQPQYTQEAMQRRIQGSVVMECVVLEDGSVAFPRVVRSLDPLYGLDASALHALRQWRFAPGTKDGVPVPVRVTVDMSFRLGGKPPSRPAPLTRPLGFPQRPERVAGVSQWTEVSLEEDGVRVRLAHPADWVLRTDGPGAVWFRVAGDDGRHLVLVSRPSDGPVRDWKRLTIEQLDIRARSSISSIESKSSQARFRGNGQVNVGGLLWVWTDYSAPAADPYVPTHFRSRVFGTTGQVRVWHFLSVVKGRMVGLIFRVAYPDDTPEANLAAEREAAVLFAAVLEKISFKVQ